ncbi:hypothetical protein GcC1_115011 [Golovinomyces cichoracearum]|uniref:Uncharacterized protein n=1 Tax=Golovinomyces cichoracearum TaxID=62708 RepID=A0A420I856_9PEZI|nr:hypothetical protein GcC1_115011 [Golovinomyces cichoracearum]
MSIRQRHETLFSYDRSTTKSLQSILRSRIISLPETSCHAGISDVLIYGLWLTRTLTEQTEGLIDITYECGVFKNHGQHLTEGQFAMGLKWAFDSLRQLPTKQAQWGTFGRFEAKWAVSNY